MPVEPQGEARIQLRNLVNGEVVYEGRSRVVVPLDVPQDVRPGVSDEVTEAAVRVDLSLWDEAVLRMRAREQTRAVILEAFDLAPADIGPLPEYDELIASTRAEFPHDRWNYGRLCPDGPMHWTPPENGEEVPRWLA